LYIVAIRFFRQLLGLQDEFYVKHLIEKQIFGPILDMLLASMPRDNLIVSSCLEFFEYIKKENIREIVKHLVQNYRSQLVALSEIDTFDDLLLRYDQTQGFMTTSDYYINDEEDVSRPQPNLHGRMMEPIQMDPAEEEYWSKLSDDEEDHAANAAEKQPQINGPTPSKPLVDYESDDDADENMDAVALPAVAPGEPSEEPSAKLEPASEAEKSEITDSEDGSVVPTTQSGASMAAGEPGISADLTRYKGADTVLDQGLRTGTPPSTTASVNSVAPPERLSEKRRREEDDDELGKLMQNKRRNSSSASSNASATTPSIVKKKRNFSGVSGATPSQKIAISITPAMLAGAGVGPEDES
jgi:protein phosphatase-4 regulatory subunit 3